MPIEVVMDTTKKHGFICLDESLVDATSDLAEAFRYREYTEYGASADMEAFSKYKPPIVWLVGHGERGKTSFVNADGTKNIVEMIVIVQWCKANNVEYLIDTACYPKSRARIVREMGVGFKYFCKNRDEEVQVIRSYVKDKAGDEQLDVWEVRDWWEKEGFSQAL